MKRQIKNNTGIKGQNIIPVVVVIYMIAAFSWWAILLLRSNQEIIALKRQLLSIEKIDPAELTSSEQYFQKRKKMILGEGVFFALSIIAGIGLIYRGYLKEARSVRSQKNFLLSVTHELKSPLTAVRLILETFQKRPVLSKESIQNLTQEALHETERLQYLIENLLLSSQLEESWRPHLKDTDLSRITNEIVIGYRNKYPETNIHWSQPAGQIRLPVDEQALISVIRNLLDNAVKYTRPGGTVEVSLLENESEVCLLVSDEGIGISEHDKKLIFNKFFRVGEEETRQQRGTGLGLYIVSQLMAAHGGTVKVSNHMPKGSTFVAIFPKMR